MRADVHGNGTYSLAETGAADAGRAAARRTRSTARKTGAKATRTARKVPGGTRATGAAKGAIARERDLPIARYDSLNADEIVKRLPELSQAELAKVEVYERKQDNRATVVERIAALRADEPWSGYDEQNVDELRKRLSGADASRARAAREYERAHKNRTSVIEATERELQNA